MLHTLLEYAEREGLAAESGFKPKLVRWLITFSRQGNFTGVVRLGEADAKNKGRLFARCPDLTHPEMIGAGCRHFLVDSLDNVALLTKDKPDDKQLAKHSNFVDLLRQAADAVPALAKIVDSLESEEQCAAIRAELAAQKAKPRDLATFAVGDDEPIVLSDAWHDWWRGFRASLAAARSAKKPPAKRTKHKPTAESAELGALHQMRCLLSGELTEPSPTHNKITGMSDVGGIAMGDVLTSFDKEAFCSYGLEQGANAAMSSEMVAAYSVALNDLVRKRSIRLAGAKIVYWYDRPVSPEEDPIRRVNNPEDEIDFGEAEVAADAADAPPVDKKQQRASAESKAKKTLDSIKHGEGRKDLSDCRYYALTLSANSGRVVVRDWMEESFTELAGNIDAWFEDLSIISRDGSKTIKRFKFASVLAAPVRDLGDIAAPLVAALWRSAVKRLPIPHEIMAQTLRRVTLDVVQGESARHARLGLLKAYWNRQFGDRPMAGEVDKHETDCAYLCGRLMAVLAYVQLKAIPSVKAGVVQRFYAAASATPALVIGRLFRTAQMAHLPEIGKKRRKLKARLEREIASIWSLMKAPPPTMFSLEHQTLFAMGFYFQVAHLQKHFPSTREFKNDDDRSENQQ